MDETHGQHRRREILATALDLSSAAGLSELSIARLADAVGMSKSGVYALFGSKQELQLAAVRQASEGYLREVIEPAEAETAGLPRLRALVDRWIRYIEGTPYRGGCFFDAASTEFGSRPGPVRDLLAELSRRWIRRLADEARLAVRLGEFPPDADSDLLAFKLHAYVAEANWARELFGDPEAFRIARRAVADALPAPPGAITASPRTKGTS